MTYFTENLMQENRKYKKFIEDFQLGVNLFPGNNSSKQLMLSMKESTQSPGPNKLTLNKSVWDPRKPAIPESKHSFYFKENCFKKINSDAKTRKSKALIEKSTTIQG